MEQKLQELITSAKSILVTSHISPDPDAVSSALLLGQTLKANYSDKTVKVVLEEKPDRKLDFLKGYDEIEYSNLFETVKKFQPELFIIVDANTYKRISRLESEKLQKHIKASGIKTAIIDHHEEEGQDDANVSINTKRPATAEEVYALFFEQLKFKKPEGFAETTLLGIISDTQRHRFDHPGYRETYRITSDLLDAGASIEKLENKIEQYNRNELEALAHLLGNITDSGEGYTYSFVTDDFLDGWQAGNKPNTDLKSAYDIFSNQFIRNYESNHWGFTVYPDVLSGPGHYGVSFRSLSSIKDVADVARRLGGGGHKAAAGAKFNASSIEEAIKKVKSAIR